MTKPSTFFAAAAFDAMKRYGAALQTLHTELSEQTALEIMCGSFIAINAADTQEEMMDGVYNAVCLEIPELADPDTDGEYVTQLVFQATSLVANKGIALTH